MYTHKTRSHFIYNNLLCKVKKYYVSYNATSSGHGCKIYCFTFSSNTCVGLPDIFFRNNPSVWQFWVWQPFSKWRPSVQVGCTVAMRSLVIFYLLASFFSYKTRPSGPSSCWVLEEQKIDLVSWKNVFKKSGVFRSV